MMWTKRLAAALGVAGAMAIAAQAHADVLTIKLDQYASAVDLTPGQNLATMTITDLSGGGVSVDVALDQAKYFASTGGGHITLAFNLYATIAASDITYASASSTFTFETGVASVPGGPSGHFGGFTYGLQGNWSGTSNHYAGPIDFSIAGVSVADFFQNSPGGYWAVVDVLGPKGTGDVGGAAAIFLSRTGGVEPIPEPSTWAMLVVGFGGLAYAGLRRAKKGGVLAPV